MIVNMSVSTEDFIYTWHYLPEILIVVLLAILSYNKWTNPEDIMENFDCINLMF